MELDEARRKSQKQSEEMDLMKRELEILKAKQAKEHNLSNKQNEKQINKKLREANWEINELRSKLNFEKHKYQISIPSHAQPSFAAMQTLPIAKPINRRHSARFLMRSQSKESANKNLFEGLHRLKKKNTNNVMRKPSITSTLKKRRSCLVFFLMFWSYELCVM